ncbi:sigma-70 family RNA polymerase sigma factor [Amycolatopsis rhabdoformis]|uniref:Sigma-70 family RNA polymerase sigma factor n=1 Tax=Amycolatopsis rhabdoformis TaxID=1448059 RepID=A0ABZ1I4F1_9PSEU|nr:sigma-70 family RNA polymerase sigma factor [Amycolatopsis rhabdoformis]WSE28510.1 sigma-70 family RNA polymerase sigma factor [Amycolatopsis rhabdoformis]
MGRQVGKVVGVRGSAERFEVFVEQHYDELFRYALVLTGDRREAEDVVHDALLRLVKHVGRADIDHERAYARQALFRVFLARRDRRRRERLVPEAGADVAAVVDAFAVSAGRAEMAALLVQLPPRMRAVLAARFYLDLSEAETAQLLGCGVGTVKSSTARGLARLRELWEATHAPAAIGRGPR